MNLILNSYADELLRRGRSLSWRRNSCAAVRRLARHLQERDNLTEWKQVRPEHLDGFVARLRSEYSTVRNRPLKETSVNRIVALVRPFFKWQTERGLLIDNPASQLKCLSFEPSLPRVLNEREINRLIETPEATTILGVRDRALMELLYAAGIRHGEAHRLNLDDVDLTARRLFVRCGKGSRDRVLPLTENAAFWLSEYLTTARAELIEQKSEKGGQFTAPPAALWLSQTGARLSYSRIDQIIAKYATTAGVKASVHTFRHCFASHLLKHGASTRHIQKLLGHQSLEATQMYLHLDISELKRLVRRLPQSSLKNCRKVYQKK